MTPTLVREAPWVDPAFWHLPHEHRRRELEAFFEAEARLLHSDGRNFDKTFVRLGQVGAWLTARTRLELRSDRCRVKGTDLIGIKTTYKQALDGLGWPPSRVSAFCDKLDQTEGIGWTAGREPDPKPNRAGDGIVIWVRRDSSVGRAHD